MAKVSFRPYRDGKAATSRLAAKYGNTTDRSLGRIDPADALQAVAMAVETELGEEDYDREPADVEDCLAALRLADDARFSIDINEMATIAGARAKGASWQAIGRALGHTEETAERAARARYAWLRRQFPNHYKFKEGGTSGT